MFVTACQAGAQTFAFSRTEVSVLMFVTFCQAKAQTFCRATTFVIQKNGSISRWDMLPFNYDTNINLIRFRKKSLHMSEPVKHRLDILCL